jgi:hypothetical protein
MKCDVIERLAIDSASGELSEDAQCLLDAYLAEHAPANEWAQSILRVYRRTEAAIGAKTKATDARSENTPLKIKPMFPSRWRPALRWAAVVIFAALIGVGAGRWSRSNVLPAGHPERKTFRPILAASRQGLDMDIGKSFWRAKAAAMFEARPYHQVNAAVHPGGLWQKYEDYIKENHHE